MCKGRVRGEVELVDSMPVSKEDLENNVHQHCIEDLGLVAYEKPHAWVLKNPRAFSEPKPCLPKPAARIWIHLDFPSFQKTVDKLIVKAESLSLEMLGDDCSDFKEILDMLQIIDYSKYKAPYFRVNFQEQDEFYKYHDASGDPAGKRAALMRALAFKLKYARAKDEADCLHVNFQRKEACLC